MSRAIARTYRNWHRVDRPVTCRSPAAGNTRQIPPCRRDRSACRDGSHSTTGRNRSRRRVTSRASVKPLRRLTRARATAVSRAAARRQVCRRWPRRQSYARRATAHAARRQPRSRTRLAPHGCNSGRIAHHYWARFEPIGASSAGTLTLVPSLDCRLRYRSADCHALPPLSR
jgi:hypothetical protein